MASFSADTSPVKGSKEPHQRSCHRWSSTSGAAQEPAITTVTKLWCFLPQGTPQIAAARPPRKELLCRGDHILAVHNPGISSTAQSCNNRKGTGAESPPAPQDVARRRWRARVTKPLWGKATLLVLSTPAQTGSDYSSPAPFLCAIKHAKRALLAWLRSSTWAPTGTPAKPKQRKSAPP